MKSLDKKLITQLFVCTNNSGCAFLGGQKLRDEIKSKLIQKLGVKEYKEKLRVNNSGCLGHCSEGIAACMMPQNKTWVEIESGDSDKFVDIVLHELKKN